MLKTLALTLLIGTSNNIGVATNEHYIRFNNGTGYYIEEDNLVKKDDIVYVSQMGNIYVIDKQ